MNYCYHHHGCKPTHLLEYTTSWLPDIFAFGLLAFLDFGLLTAPVHLPIILCPSTTSAYHIKSILIFSHSSPSVYSSFDFRCQQSACLSHAIFMTDLSDAGTMWRVLLNCSEYAADAHIRRAFPCFLSQTCQTLALSLLLTCVSHGSFSPPPTSLLETHYILTYRTFSQPDLSDAGAVATTDLLLCQLLLFLRAPSRRTLAPQTFDASYFRGQTGEALVLSDGVWADLSG